MMLNDPLFPLAASAISRPLDVSKRVALTAAAALIPGPLALAPALIALQRSRDAAVKPDAGNPATGAGAAPAPAPPVGPMLILVPDVVGKSVKDATVLLIGAGLVATTVQNESLAAEMGFVLVQDPTGTPTKRLPAGSTVKLWVGNGPKPVPVDPVIEAFKVQIAPVNATLVATNTTMVNIQGMLTSMQATQLEILAALTSLNSTMGTKSKGQ